MVALEKSIALMGLMGSGKSTLGLQLALHLGIPFTDLDQQIEKMAGASIHEIFERYGEGYFRRLEHEALLDVSGLSPRVISLGGGAPCFMNNMEVIQHNTFSIYLKVSTPELVRRISQSRTIRPLAAGLSPEALEATMNSQCIAREPWYLKANLIVESDDIDLAMLIKLLAP